MPTTSPTTTLVTHLTTRPPHWWQHHGRLTVRIHPAHGEPFTTTLTGGGVASLTSQLADRFGITVWRWAR